MYTVNGWITRMVYHAWLGQVREADRCRQRVELLRIQNSPRQYLEGGHLMPEIAAYAAASDLTRVKQRIDEVEGMAPPLRGLAADRALRARRVPAPARRTAERARGVRRGPRAHRRRPACRVGAPRRRRARDARGDGRRRAGGRARRGVRRGRAGERARLSRQLRPPAARALAEPARSPRAGGRAWQDVAIEELLKLGSSGLHLGLAYETRARVAGRARDEQAFERFAQLCAEQYRLSENRALCARYDRLVERGQGGGAGRPRGPARGGRLLVHLERHVRVADHQHDGGRRGPRSAWSAASSS